MIPSLNRIFDRPGRVAWALFFLTLAVFAPAAGLPFLDIDDPDYLLDNEKLRQGLETLAWAFHSTFHGHWHPVTWLAHSADVALFGLEPWGHHAVSAALHAAAAALFFLTIQRATRRTGPSLLAAAFFAWHPLRVESVAWVAERKDVLALLFSSAAALAYVSARPKPGPTPAVHVLFALALMSKATAVTLPVLLLLLDRWPLERKEGLEARLREKAGLFAMAGAAALVALSAIELVPAERFGLAERASSAAFAVWSYLGQSLWPRPALFHPMTRQSAGAALAAGGALLAATGLAWAMRRRLPWVWFGWAWFLVALAPMTGLFQVGGQATADRYTYLPHLGLAAAAAFTLCAMPARPAAALGAAAALLLAAGTRAELREWRTPKTLYLRALGAWPDHYQLRNALGKSLAREGRHAEAELEFRRAAQLRPDDPGSLNNLGLELMRRGRLEEAAPLLERAAESNPAASVHGNLGLVYAGLGRLEEAKLQYEAALRLSPQHAGTHVNLGNLLFREGRRQEAMARYRKALESEPGHAEALNNLGIGLQLEGRTEEAVRMFRAALIARPGYKAAEDNLRLAVEGTGEGFTEELRLR